MSNQLAAFVDTIRRTGLVSHEKADQVAAWAGEPNADPQIVARNIVQRGWLTAFQVKLIWKGRASELFLSQYVLVERLGEGGMGEVFKARHRRMERLVALKVIRKEKLSSPEAVKRFHQEIQTAAALAHENVVMAYDADQAGDRHFFAMEYVDGTNLAKLVKEQGPMPTHLACDCIRQAALGLQHAFERGMVHRDIKPSNLLLGKGGVLKILDMGLARLEESPTGDIESRITQEGLVIGTPDFLSPEQARDARAVDIRSDIYALGCSFYYLLMGHTPYPGGTPTEKMLRHTTEPAPMVSRTDVPVHVAGIVSKMMAKKPSERFQTPVEVAVALQPFSRPFPAESEPLTLELAEPPTDRGRSERSAESGTESRFRLPAPRPVDTSPVERTRKNGLIAISVGASVLVIAAVVIFLLVRTSKESSGQPLDKEYKAVMVPKGGGEGPEMTLVLIPTGSFDMGSPEEEQGRGNEEGPVHHVEITKPIYMGSTEVTLRQYHAVVGQLPAAYVRLKKSTEDVDLDAPATMVSHGEASSFCRKLNGEPGVKKEGWEFRLPTEAEWEYACRAGSKSRFSVGDSLNSSQADFGEAAGKFPGRVGRFPPNAFGLFDMHGSAAEWVSDMYDPNYYKESPTQDPTGPRNRAMHGIRGGSFHESADACRSARRHGRYPELSKDFETAMRGIGFRVVMAQTGK